MYTHGNACIRVITHAHKHTHIPPQNTKSLKQNDIIVDLSSVHHDKGQAKPNPSHAFVSIANATSPSRRSATLITAITIKPETINLKPET